ncbi:serine hydrolase domain-containing protein [Sphaerothrix gracilis]|uniref:serine hydrolase domain-containing protein n=1 Tax=Sphaerothrix gracilis TaxID=3151835 RepID=UPI0031FD9E04
MRSSLETQLQATVEAALSQSQVPGAAIAIWLDGQSCLEAGIGYGDKRQQVPLPVDASFYIYSITKVLIATASLYLADQKRLELDASVQSYLANFSLDRTITLHHLLSHTSGLPDYGGTAAYKEAVKANPRRPWSLSTFFELAQAQGLQFAPGTDWAYSNIGYLLLKQVLEQVTDLTLGQLLDQVIFRPLSLAKTFVPETLEQVGELTPGYTACWSQDELQNMTQVYHPSWVAHSVVISTAPELAKIIDALLSGQIISPSLVEQMSQPVHTLGKYPLFTSLGYGLGLFIDDASPYGIVRGHTGEGPGYSVAAFHLQKLANVRATLVVLANRDKPDFGLSLIYRIAQTIAANS